MPHAYADAAAFRAHRPENDLRELSDPELDAVDDARLDRALEAASAEIDGWLGGRYATPVEPVPHTLTIAAMDIAFYRLQLSVAASPSEAARQQYVDWRSYFGKVASGAMDLPTPDETPSAVSAASEVLFDGPAQTFTRAGMRGF